MVTELLTKFNNYTELKYETNTTAMANIGYKINSNNKVSIPFILTPQLNPKKSIQDTL
jgi:predicted methyltransferase